MNAREEFWSGEFGNEYNRRSPGNVAANIAFFRDRLAGRGVNSVLELGCGVGSNLRALRSLLPHSVELAGVEINEEAAQAAEKYAQIHRASLLEWVPAREYELAFTKGVLIHIAPEDLPAAYDALWAASSRYILIAEYFNPTPMEVPYRGHAGRLWKRDFASELVQRFDIRLLDYGFTWRADPVAPQDDLTWFLFEKC